MNRSVVKGKWKSARWMWRVVGDLLFPDKPLWSMANMDIGPTLPTIRESPRWKQNSDFVFSFSSSCSLRPCGKRELSCKFSSAALVLQRCPDYLIPRITPSYLYRTKVKSNLMINLATQNCKNQNPSLTMESIRQMAFIFLFILNYLPNIIERECHVPWFVESHPQDDF